MGRIDNRGIPAPRYVRDKEKFIKQLDKAYRQLFDYVLLQLSFNPDDPKAIRDTEVLRQVNYYLKQLDEEVARGLERLIKRSFQDGQAYHLLSVKEAKTWDEALSQASFNKIQMSKVEALYNDTYSDILLATENTKKSIKVLVKDTVRKVAQYHSVKNTNYTQQARELEAELSKKGMSQKISKQGFVGITDRAGRKWDLKTYSKMVIKTKVNDAFTQGTMYEAEETGFDLAVISDHGAEDACRKWEGMVISLTGKTKGYPTYKEARATNEIFHPNCEHHFHSIRNLDMLHPDDVKSHQKKLGSIGNYKKRVYKRKSVKR